MKKTILLILILSMSQLALCVSDESENILRVNDAITDSDAGWVAGATTVSGLTTSEKHKLSMPDPIRTQDQKPVLAPTGVMYDAEFDWRNKDGKNWVTPVRSQGSCGSCWAFAAIATMESAILICTENPDKDIDLSEQHLVSDCCSAGSCGGGWPDWALDYIRDTGVTTEACCPYTSRDGSCNLCDGWSETAWQITDHLYVEPTKEDFKSALQIYGPITVVLTVPEDWYYYRSGVYTPTWTGGVGWANHAVVLVGWSDADNCWIIKNSWGAEWGESGYARVKYGDLEKYNYAYAIAGIVDSGSSPDTDVWIKPVSAVATSNHSSNYAAEMAIDGMTNTYWFSKAHETNPTITFDLGEPTTINQVRAMIFHKDVPMTVDIAVSKDNSTWYTVATNFEIINGSEYTNIEFDMCRTQYIRMTETGFARMYGTCTEFNVFCHEGNSDEGNMSLTIHYLTSPDRTISIDETDLAWMMLSHQNHTLLKWWNR